MLNCFHHRRCKWECKLRFARLSGRTQLPGVYRFETIELERLLSEIKKKDLTNPRKRATIRTLINYCCVPGKQKPAFGGLADLQNPPHKWHGFRIFAHNPEVDGKCHSGIKSKPPLLRNGYFYFIDRWIAGPLLKLILVRKASDPKNLKIF
jgi:hypothetical protein